MLVKEALMEAGRTDLIGYDKKCLIRPQKGTKYEKNGTTTRREGTPKKKKAIRNVHKKKRGKA